MWEPGILHQAALPPVIKQQEQGLAKFLETIRIKSQLNMYKVHAASATQSTDDIDMTEQQ